MANCVGLGGGSEELPLPIYFVSAAPREATQPLVVSEIAEDRFDGGAAPAVDNIFSQMRYSACRYPVRLTFVAAGTRCISRYCGAGLRPVA